jgi:hypothetical protein
MSPPIQLRPGRILLYQGRRLLVARVDERGVQALDLATAAPYLDQHRYHLYLTPLGWAVDHRVDRIFVHWLPPVLLNTILGFLRPRGRLVLRRLSKQIKQDIVQLDPAVRQLLLSPESGLDEALRREDWEMVFLQHARDPHLPLSRAELKSLPGRVYQIFRHLENRAQAGDTKYGFDWLLRPREYWTFETVTYLRRKYGYRSADLDDLVHFSSATWEVETIRYLLWTHPYPLASVQRLINQAIQEERLDILVAALDHVERRRPADLHLVVTGVAVEAGMYNKAALMAWLLDRYQHHPQLRRILDDYLEHIVEQHQLVLEALASRLPFGFDDIPAQETTKWRKLLARRRRRRRVDDD